MQHDNGQKYRLLNWSLITVLSKEKDIDINTSAARSGIVSKLMMMAIIILIFAFFLFNYYIDFVHCYSKYEKYWAA